MRLLISIISAFLLFSKVSSQERLTDVKSGISSSHYSISKHKDSLYLAEVTKLGLINIYTIDAQTDEKKIRTSYQINHKFYWPPNIFFQYPYLSFSVSNEVSVFNANNQIYKSIIVAEPDERVNLYTSSADDKGLIISTYNYDQKKYNYKILYFKGELEDLPSEKLTYYKKSKSKVLNYDSEFGIKYYLFDLNNKNNIFITSKSNYSNRPILVDSTCYFNTDSALYKYENNEFEKIKDLPAAYDSYSEMYQIDSLIYNVTPININEIHVIVINTKRQNFIKEFIMPLPRANYTSRSVRISDNGYSYLENNQIRIIPDLKDTSKIVKGSFLNFIAGSSIYNGKYYLFISFDSILIYDFEGILLNSVKLNPPSTLIAPNFQTIHDNIFIVSGSWRQQKIWKLSKTNHTFNTIDIVDEFDTGTDHYPIHILNDEIVLESIRDLYKIVDKQIVHQTPNGISRNLLVKDGESFIYIEKAGSYKNLIKFDGIKPTKILEFHELIRTDDLSITDNYYFFEGALYHSFISKKDNKLTLNKANFGLSLPLEFENELFLYGWNGVKLANEDKLIFTNKVNKLISLEDQLYAISTSIYKYNKIDSTFSEIIEDNLYKSHPHKINSSLYLFAKWNIYNNYSFTTFDGKITYNLNLPATVNRYEIYDDILYLEYSQNGKQIGMLYDVTKKESLYSFELETNQRFLGYINNKLESVLLTYNYILNEYQVIKLNQNYIVEDHQVIKNASAYSRGSLDIINEDIFLYLSMGIFSIDLEKQKWVNQIKPSISNITEATSSNNTVYFWGEESLTGGQYYKYEVTNNEVPPHFIPTLGFSMFPNPASESIEFSWSSNKQTEARVYNSTGQKVKSLLLEPSTKSLTIQDLPVGVYFLELTSQGSSERKIGKFVKI